MRNVRNMAISVIGIAVILLIEYLGFFEGLNNHLYDLSFRIRGTRHHADRIIIAAIDEKTLKDLGRWPIRRSYYGRFLEKVGEAAVVGFDIIMAEPSEDDPMLAEAIRQGRVILPVYFDGNLDPVFPARSFEPRAVGHIHVEPDIDGVVRKYFHTIHASEVTLPSISSVMYETVTGEKMGRQPVRSDRSAPPDHKKLLQRDLMHINYAGPAGTFQTISFSEVLEGKYPAPFFRDKIVLVGLTAIGLEDRILTPFSQQRNKMAGVEGHANMLNTLFARNAIREAPSSMMHLAAVALSLSMLLVFLQLSEKKAVLMWLFSLVFLSMIAYTLFVSLQLWVNPALLFAAVTAMFVTAYLFRLDEAARKLDRGYQGVASQLRWKATALDAAGRGGLIAFLSAGGINAKARILTDIIEQLLFEKKLIDAALMNDIHGILLFDPAGKRIIENERARAIFSALSIKVENFGDFNTSLLPHILKDHMAEDVKNDNVMFGTNITSTLFFSAPDNRYLKMDSSLISFNDEEYLLCVFADVTRIKELELLKGQIVSTVSHELKQPLTVIQGLSELLDLNLTGKEKKYIEMIRHEVQRMAQFINRFLDISRLESGKELIMKEPVDMVEMLNQLVPLIRTLTDAKEMHMITRLPDRISTVMLDGDLTRQCILNLVENAIKYSPPGRDVTIELAEELGRVRVDVIDTGYGIEEREMGKIFNKFYRGRAAHDNGSRGSGLGLAFVKEAIESQGGSISVKSTPGTGSTFSIHFPST